MFTVEQIRQEHSKIKSGSDFPKYIQDLIQLGISSYETYVSDGHTHYQGINGFNCTSDARYGTLDVTVKINKYQFQNDLKAHQQGKTDYPTFCKDCAKSGIEKWVVCMDNMTCTYFDKTGNKILVEQIPN